MSATPQDADPAAVTEWIRRLRNAQGCMRLAPDPSNPLAVTAYNEALRQLAAEPRTEPGTAEPEPSP